MLALGLVGLACAGSPTPATDRPFVFSRDTFAYTNELVWQYSVDVDGASWEAEWPEEGTRFGQRCPQMVRMVRQFHMGARFDPRLPALTQAETAERIRELVERDARSPDRSLSPVVFPGYGGLRELSLAHEQALKDATGAPWKSYLQRGNWRMVYPFFRRNQQRTAAELRDAVAEGHLPLVRIVRFPKVEINHSLLVFGAEETPTEIRFATYDPNVADEPVPLTYDRATRTFLFPPADFFPGGRVDVYEIYNGILR